MSSFYLLSFFLRAIIFFFSRFIPCTFRRVLIMYTVSSIMEVKMFVDNIHMIFIMPYIDLHILSITNLFYLHFFENLFSAHGWTLAYQFINAHYLHLFFKTMKIGGRDACPCITLIVTSIIVYSIIDILLIIHFIE